MGINMRNDESSSVFAKCDCCCSAIEVEFDEELDNFLVALWANGNTSRPLSTKERKRWCEHIMKTGNPWADHTILTKQSARRIAEFIIKKLDYVEPKTKDVRNPRKPSRESRKRRS
jgi:hypothetical protein